MEERFIFDNEIPRGYTSGEETFIVNHLVVVISFVSADDRVRRRDLPGGNPQLVPRSILEKLIYGGS